MLTLSTPLCLLCFSPVRPLAALWTVAHQAPLSVGFSRQECWSGLSCSPPGDLPDPGIEPVSLVSPALVGGFFTTSATWEAFLYGQIQIWTLAMNFYREETVLEKCNTNYL